MNHERGRKHEEHVRARDPRTVTDPVCGMAVDPDNARGGSAQRDGRTHHFCSDACRESFLGEPERFVGPRPGIGATPGPSEAKRGTPGTVQYTCPMHPEIVRDAPGSCPICGMALESRTITADEEENPELSDMTRRFWVGLGLTVPVFVMAMGEMIPGAPLQGLLSPAVQEWAELVLATPVVLWAGWPFFARMWASLVIDSCVRNVLSQA